jgi:hypothetical protein
VAASRSSRPASFWSRQPPSCCSGIDDSSQPPLLTTLLALRQAGSRSLRTPTPLIDLAIAPVAGYLGTKAMEPVGTWLYEHESQADREREIEPA